MRNKTADHVWRGLEQQIYGGKPQPSVTQELLQSLKWLLPLAEAYLKSAPSHPDHAKLESARAAIAKAEGL